MPKRRSLDDRLAADEPIGRHAFDLEPEPDTDRAADGPPPTVNGPPSTPAEAPQEPGSWEANHKRVTFYCPADLIAQIEAERPRSGRSKSRVIVDAIRAHLDAPA